MVYLLPYLKYPADPPSTFYDDRQAIAIAISAYICTLLFTLQLIFALYNTWFYLIKQGKWRIFSLSMFYALTILCVTLRLVITVLCVKAAVTLNVV